MKNAKSQYGSEKPIFSWYGFTTSETVEIGLEDGGMQCDKTYMHCNFRAIPAGAGDSGIARGAGASEEFHLLIEKYSSKAINIYHELCGMFTKMFSSE